MRRKFNTASQVLFLVSTECRLKTAPFESMEYSRLLLNQKKINYIYEFMTEGVAVVDNNYPS